MSSLITAFELFQDQQRQDVMEEVGLPSPFLCKYISYMYI